ncbi:uncharacterized protein LOC143620908 [Bidens hawaiensis]|uniref:uncharacterized protein LOC143620908 n=1 Tax=Bidens hawaiensis TaxID=980011 RepID=UPI0040497982
MRLSASILATYGLLNGALSFRGHDESETSLYRGHFIELLKLFGVINEEIGKVILSNAPKNNQMTAPSIQKEICNYFAAEVLKKIFDELGDDVFSILVDESRDVSEKEQMQFVGLVHVMETTVLSLKKANDELFAHYNVSLSRIRDQGYDGASNMSVSSLVNVVGASCKRVDLIRESQRERLGLNPEVETGSGQNQELSFARAGDTRWSSHEKRMTRLVSLYPSVIDVLEYIENSGDLDAHKNVTSFCEKYDIEMVNMEAVYVDPKNRRKKTGITNRQHYVVNNFNTVLDMQIQELGNRFNEVTTYLLIYMSSLSPCLNFRAFDKLNLLKLAEMYPCDFSFDEKDKLIYELGNYIANVK